MINNVYSLPELDFVGGSSEDLVFHVYCDKTNPKPFGLTGCTANFSIINFVNKNGAPVVSKTMTVRMDESETFYNKLSEKVNEAENKPYKQIASNVNSIKVAVITCICTLLVSGIIGAIVMFGK